MTAPYDDRILHSLRRITRAVDLYSRQLAKEHSLTGPQLMCIKTLGTAGTMAPSVLAQEVALSHPTVTGIIDRLVARGLVRRRRSPKDRRRVLLALTDQGQQALLDAPAPLHSKFSARLAQLDDDQQRCIDETLRQVVAMMEDVDLIDYDD